MTSTNGSGKSGIKQLLQSGILAPLFYFVLLAVWNLTVYFCLIQSEIGRWPVCWDFIHYYQCGAMVLSPDRFQVYDPQLQMAWTNKLISPVHVEEIWFIQFVPFVFPLMVPFALLPLKWSYVVWSLVSTLAGLFVLVLILRRRSWKPFAISGFCLGALACCPAFLNTWWGQFAWFYLFMLGLYFLFLEDNKDVKAGVILSLLCIKPQYIPYLLVPPLAAKRWRVLAVAALSELVLALLAVLAIGWDAVVHYPLTLLSAEKQSGIMQVNALDMVSLRGPLSLVLPHTLAFGLSFLLNLAMLPVTWILWRQACRAEEGWRRSWAMAVTVMAIIVLSPHSHAYDCLFLMLAAALTMPSAYLRDLLAPPEAGKIPGENENPPGKLYKAGFRIWMLCLYSYPIVSWGLYLSLNDFDNKIYPKVYAIINTIVLLAGLTCCLISSKQKKSIRQD